MEHTQTRVFYNPPHIIIAVGVYIYIFIVANIKIIGIMLISQLIKGSKEKFFIKPNFRRKYQTSSSGLYYIFIYILIYLSTIIKTVVCLHIYIFRVTLSVISMGEN